MKNLKLLAVLASAAILGGCAGAFDPPSVLNSRVESALKADPEVGKFPIKVTNDYGHVTLSGTVNNEWQQFKAKQVADKVDGVKTVKNSIKVSE